MSITLAFDPVNQVVNDAPLQEFLRGKAVFSLKDHFFLHEGKAYLTFIITYNQAVEPVPVASHKLPQVTMVPGSTRSRLPSPCP